MCVCDQLTMTRNLSCLICAFGRVKKRMQEDMHIRITRKWASLFFRTKLLQLTNIIEGLGYLTWLVLDKFKFYKCLFKIE